MTQKKKKTKKSLPSKPIVAERNYSEFRGVMILSSSLILLLSLFSFAFDAPQDNLLGIVGDKLGWIFHALFGLSSYLVAMYCLWIGWRICFQKQINNPYAKLFWFGLMASSLCMLLALIEIRFPDAGTYLQTNLYPALWGQKLKLHLGGAFFHFLLHDMPSFNLMRILNAFGVAVLCTLTLFISILYLAKRPPKMFIKQLMLYLAEKNAANPVENEVLVPALQLGKRVNSLSKLEAPLSAAASLLRYVKLKIPSAASSEGTTANGGLSGLDELLAIQPELNPKVRPSMSNKEALAKDKDRELMAKERKSGQSSPSQTNFSQSFGEDAPANTSKNTKNPKPKEQPLKIPQQMGPEGDFSNYQLPEATLLTVPKKVDQSSLKKDLKRQAEVLEETLQSFGIEAKVGQINCGPTINSFEVHPAIGVKVQKIKALEDDIALNMEAKSIRIIAPIPGKAAVGIEIPTPQPQEVAFKDLLQAYQQSGKKFHIPILLGKAVNGDYVMSDLTKMPHCIIAGATGSGKSVCINTIVMSILLTSKPDEIKLLMVDPKKVELTPYTALPHMLAPVITEPQGAAAALQWLVKEMERRYEILKQTGVRNIESFNNRTLPPKDPENPSDIPDKLYYIVCIVDELADLMMVSSNDIETPIARIAQMARAVGIHMILATQRPSREVITGIIKANFPTRIAFKVASRINSQIILDETGAETLLGNGDMLFLPPGTSHLTRVQGAFIRDEDINAVIEFLSSQAPPNYKFASFDAMPSSYDGGSSGKKAESTDSLYEQALETVQTTGNASTTFLQRKLKIGYARAASLMDELEKNGIVGPADGARARQILKFNLPTKLSQECAKTAADEGNSFDDDDGDEE